MKEQTSRKHTPGPWHISGKHGNLRTEVVSGGRAIAAVWTHQSVPVDVTDPQRGNTEQPLEEGAGNLRLIAAAPDLLAACNAAMDAMIREDFGTLTLVPLIRAAIAKAEGRQ